LAFWASLNHRMKKLENDGSMFAVSPDPASGSDFAQVLSRVAGCGDQTRSEGDRVLQLALDQSVRSRRVEQLLPTPAEVLRRTPISFEAAAVVKTARQAVRAVLNEEDERLLLVVGPCSIHDYDAALEYARLLRELQKQVEPTILLIMRVYLEKPRSSVGWKGFLSDPNLDNSFNIPKGLSRGRELLLEINHMGVPAASEALSLTSPLYFEDLVAWTAIGARTVESQLHRELASGLATPVGIKNSTDGNVEVAVRALEAVFSEHHVPGMDVDGRACIYHTSGNPHGHIVLRGGRQPNYDSASITACENLLKNVGLPRNILVDCSHGNSARRPDRQAEVLRAVLAQILCGCRSVKGFMLESNIEWGSQPWAGTPKGLRYGVSITDACMGWQATRELILELHAALLLDRSRRCYS
jgi:3-deoxy-7-phosphoheptulonate synthase